MSSLQCPPGFTKWMNVTSYVKCKFCNNISNKVHMPRFRISARSFCIESQNSGHQDLFHKDCKSGKAQDFKSRRTQDLGSFQSLPMVMTSKETLYSALRKARMIGPTQGIKNLAKRERNKGAKQLDALMKELAIPLRRYVEKFPTLEELHPYEQSLIKFTFGKGKYEEVLDAVDVLRKRILSIGKERAALCAKSVSMREAQQRLNEGFTTLEELVQHKGTAVDELVEIAKRLRSMPVFNPKMPTLCLVGAPNVGKSSLVRVLSTGKPEVCNYPFTTRSILMGHIIAEHETFQVTDTPGLLRRNDEERNKLERLTLSAIQHLPSAILFVHDLSGHCGTAASDQFYIYNDIKERFADRLWIDVVSKADLLTRRESCETVEEEYRAFGPKGSLYVSIKSNQGIEDLKQRVQNILALQSRRMETDIPCCPVS